MYVRSTRGLLLVLAAGSGSPGLAPGSASGVVSQSEDTFSGATHVQPICGQDAVGTFNVASTKGLAFFWQFARARGASRVVGVVSREAARLIDVSQCTASDKCNACGAVDRQLDTRAPLQLGFLRYAVLNC